MEPIPLRTLTLLLNYERTTSEPNYEGRKLLTTTLVDPTLFDKTGILMQQILKGKPNSVKKDNLHVYDSDKTNVGVDSTTIQLSTEIEPAVTQLSPQQREVIYHETRGIDGCYKAIVLYQEFFKLTPPNQQISIQIKDEPPVLVSTDPRVIMEFVVHDPKLLTISTVNSLPILTVTGGDDESMHAVLGFPKPGESHVEYVVDMTRMQFGETGRGLFGELYWMGSADDYMGAAEKVCKKMELWGSSSRVGPSEHDTWLRECARRAWKRWQNRDKEGWCDYCGVGGANLQKCAACSKMLYCSKEHQRNGWKLHKFACEKKK